MASAISVCITILSLYYLFAHVGAQTSTVEKDALISLYNATGGERWYKRWDTSTDPCANGWYGVVCQNNRVWSVSLQANNLVGTLPSQLSELQALEFLYLSKNNLSSSIPSSYGDITSIQHFGFDFNQLNGSVPSSFASLTGMQALYLQGNEFSGGIDWLSSMSVIQYVFLSNNHFSGTIPQGVAELWNLQQLGIDSNKFSGSIPSGFNVKQNFLQAIYLQNNNLSGPLSADLCSVQTCFATNNSFSCPLPAPGCCSVDTCV